MREHSYRACWFMTERTPTNTSHIVDVWLSRTLWMYGFRTLSTQRAFGTAEPYRKSTSARFQIRESEITCSQPFRKWKTIQKHLLRTKWWCSEPHDIFRIPSSRRGSGTFAEPSRISTSAKSEMSKLESPWSQLFRTSKFFKKLLLTKKLWCFKKSSFFFTLSCADSCWPKIWQWHTQIHEWTFPESSPDPSFLRGVA